MIQTYKPTTPCIKTALPSKLPYTVIKVK